MSGIKGSAEANDASPFPRPLYRLSLRPRAKSSSGMAGDNETPRVQPLSGYGLTGREERGDAGADGSSFERRRPISR
jgi:hypothetical protein